MRKRFCILATAVALFSMLPQTANAIQDEVSLEADGPVLFGEVKEKEIYSLSNYAEDIKTSGANVDVITREDIRKQNSPSFSDLLQQQGSVYVHNSYGSDGNPTSVRMRGTDRVKFLMDGIRADRPSMSASGIESQFLNSDDIERIEIIRGPQGNVSGVNASGGLISVQTRRGKGPFSLEFGSEFGNRGSFKERFAVMSGNEKMDYYLGLTYYKTDGNMWLSDLGRVEHDAFKNLNFVSNFGVRLLNNKADLRNIFRISNSTKDNGLAFDSWTGAPYIAEAGNYTHTLDLQEILSFNHKPTDKYSYDVKFGLYHNRSNNYTLPDNINSDPNHEELSEISSSRINLITQHNYNIFDWNTISLGYNLESEFIDALSNSLSSYMNYYDNYNGSTIQHDVYLNDLINIKDLLFIRGGARLISNSQYGNYVTPNVSAALVLPTFKLEGAKTKFRGSWGQSVNTPTLYQRFGINNYYGLIPNPNLEAERLMGWDAGIEQSFFNDKISLDFGYFDNKYTDYIDWYSDYPNSYKGWYENISSANIHGYEAKLTYQPNNKVKLVLNYTYTKSEDETTGEVLAACPENMVSGTVYWTPNDRITLFAGVDGTSQRAISSKKDADFAPGYVNARLGGNLKLVSYKGLDVSLKATIYNLFNQNICGYKQGNTYYYAPGIRFMAGLFFKYTLPEKINDKETL